ncbi:hypothetical protein KEM55_005514 [Ascosphaera atra]|nr:hypothetical protein KEM55_005514 [Ascosphaera atra]
MKEQNGIGRQSQTGALTTMVPGSHPSEYANEASTTQTGTDQKDSSNQTDQAQQQQNQHLPHPPQSVMQPLSSSFREAEPNMSLFPASLPGDENMPNTQVGDSATWSSQSYQPDRAPQFLHPSSSWLSSSFSKPSHPSPQTNTSSNPKESSNSGNQSSGGPQQQSTNSGLGWSQPSPPPRKWLDELSASRFHDDLVAKTSDFTVEQLETLNAQLVYLVWQHRAEWNRNVILNKLSDTFPQILRDVSNLASDEEQALETL